MAEVLVDMNLAGFNNDFFEMETAVVKLQKTLTWLLSQLDSMNVRRLSTNLTEIKSDDGNTRLNGTQIIMKDAAGTTRAVLGLNKENNSFEFVLSDKNGNETITLDSNGDAVFSGKVTASAISGSTITMIDDEDVTRAYIGVNTNGDFMFTLNNNDGDPTIAIDDNGDAVFKGKIQGGEITSDTTINVTENASIGETLILKDGETVGAELSIFDGDVPTLLISGKGGRPIYISTGTTLWLSANAINMSAAGGVKIGSKTVAKETSATGSFVSQDGKTITVQNGIIQSIN